MNAAPHGLAARMTEQSADSTFRAESMYGSIEWVAVTLGRSISWVRTHRSELEKQGFPAQDALLGYWIKKDVHAWIDHRRRIADATEVVQSSSVSQPKVNTDAL